MLLVQTYCFMAFLDLIKEMETNDVFATTCE